MRLASALVWAFATLWAPPGTDPESAESPCRLVLVERQIVQQNGRWLVRYKVRYEAAPGSAALDLSASDLAVDYEAWVSNSRSKPHTVPRKSHTRFALSESNSVQTTVISSSNDRQRCRERISLALSAGDRPLAEPTPAKTTFLPLRVPPGENFWVYLILDHDHFLHGTYDPLLGVRQFELRLGSCRLLDSIPLDAEQASSAPVINLSTPPKERLDPRQFRSAPDSLYLAADLPGYQYFRFDDLPVRYGTQFRLSFWYLIGLGTEGSCHVRVMEYQDTPNAWYRLDGGFDDQMTLQGRWQRFEQTFQSRDETTTMALDFRIVGANVGEMWIDDVELIPLYEEPVQQSEKHGVGKRTIGHKDDRVIRTAGGKLARDRP